jgi:hypothetical protein
VDDGNGTHHKPARKGKHDVNTRGRGKPKRCQLVVTKSWSDVRAQQGEGEGGGHVVQPGGSWSACTEVKAGPETGAFERGRGGGSQFQGPPVRGVAAVLLLGVQKDRGKEGRVERPKLRGPEARRRIVKRRPPSNRGSTVGARGLKGRKGGSAGRIAASVAPAAANRAAGGEPQAKPPRGAGEGRAGQPPGPTTW